MIWIVVNKLREQRPLVYYISAGILFVLAQLTYFLLSRPICNGTNAKIDGSFLATALETASVIVLYLAWQGITEGSSISRRVCEPTCSPTVRWQTTGARMYTFNEWRELFYIMMLPLRHDIGNDIPSPTLFCSGFSQVSFGLRNCPPLRLGREHCLFAWFYFNSLVYLYINFTKGSK